MLGDAQIDKRGVHRRLSAGVRRLNKRVFTPTAVFTPFPTDTDTEAPVASATQPVANPNPSTTRPLLLPPTTTPVASSAVPTTSAAVSTSLPGPATSLATVPTQPTTSASVPPATTLPPTTQVRVTTPVQQTPATQSVADAVTAVTQTLTSTRSPTTTPVSSAAAAASPTATPSSSVSTGVVIGGIVAAIIGVAGILFAVIYFIRRSRKSDEGDDGNDFNAQAFRRQSVALRDDDVPVMSRAMTLNRGGASTPRPPTMIERKMASTPVAYPVPPVPHPYGYAGAYGQPSFSPGQIMTPGPYTPTTVNSAHPFFSPYGQSPIGSPVSVAAYDSAYNADGHPISRQPSNGSSTVLSRQPSSAAQPAVQATPETDYVDLNRSSVTPFQAAQYAEISRRLNTTPPQPLPASEVAEVAEEIEQDEPVPVPPQKSVEPLELQPSISFDEPRHLAVQPTPREHSFPESPFADPTMSFHEEQMQHAPQARDSLFAEPQPPSPTFSSKSRITSTPPTLPEIQIQQRPFSPVSLDFPLVPSTPHPVPSPLGSTFSIPSPPPSAHFPETTAPASATPTLRDHVVAGAPMAKRPDTVYTLYDEDDAYAGI
ncbi:hypothetical protein BV20DRAFT_955993 [Pilatotrama ljubarskyi]|nr:hypothetical protein BV20DRAFT_955993 [Pilatotrama ljubarskyi]